MRAVPVEQRVLSTLVDDFDGAVADVTRTDVARTLAALRRCMS